MTDRLAKPIVELEAPQTTQMTTDSSEADIARPEALQSPTVTPEQQQTDSRDVILNQAELRKAPSDGSWSFAKEPFQVWEHPLFPISADAIGVERGLAQQNFDVMQNIIEYAVNLVGTDDPTVIFNFLTYQKRHAPGTTLYAFARHMELLAKRIGREGV